MSRTIERGVSVNVATGELIYLCSCYRRVAIPIGELVPDEFVDYCGCGDSRYCVTAGEVAHYRQLAGLPQLGE